MPNYPQKLVLQCNFLSVPVDFSFLMVKKDQRERREIFAFATLRKKFHSVPTFLHMQNQSTLAVFDYDHTLITGDALWSFLFYVAGGVNLAWAVAVTMAQWIWRYTVNKHDPEISDMRTFVKAGLLRRLLAGKIVTEIAPAVEKLRAWQQWNEPMRQAVLDHAAQGHHIVIASGSLDVYLHTLAKDLPHEAIICTEIGIVDGRFTGEMMSGNCVRQRKAELVRDYITAHGPFADSWGYGNFPHDVPMLGVVRKRVLV